MSAVILTPATKNVKGGQQSLKALNWRSYWTKNHAKHKRSSLKLCLNKWFQTISRPWVWGQNQGFCTNSNQEASSVVFSSMNNCSKDKSRRFFYFIFFYQIVIGNEKWTHYNNPKLKKSWGKPWINLKDQTTYSCMARSFCCASGGMCSEWSMMYKLLQPIKTITSKCSQAQLSQASKLKQVQYAKRDDKVILKHNTRPHVACEM